MESLRRESCRSVERGQVLGLKHNMGAVQGYDTLTVGSPCLPPGTPPLRGTLPKIRIPERGEVTKCSVMLKNGATLLGLET